MPHTLRLPWALTLLCAIAAGLSLRLAFPEPHVWVCAPIGVYLWLRMLVGRGFWAGLWWSLLAGLAFWLSLIHWLTLYLGPLPWAALGTLMAIYMALAGGVMAWLMRWVPRLWGGALGKYVLLPALLASVWVGREVFAMSWPYGGFSWGRIAMSQSAGWFAEALAWVGPNGLSWLIVALTALCLQLMVSRHHTPMRSLRSANAWLAVGAGVLAMSLVPAWPLASAGELRVLAVQGGADASLFTNLAPGSVLAAHANETMRNVDKPVDVVVWPENAADIDPLRSRTSAAVLTAISQRFQAPLVVGAITVREDEYFNTSLQWESPVGVVNWYDKAHPVPFAEYMPDRSFWRPFAPDLIDLVSRDYQAGTRSNVFDVGDARAGIAICFDIAYDNLITAMVAGDAGVIFAQTNNADFGRTDESIQQLAIAQMRAIETGRPVVNISTVGTSAIFDARGRTLAQLETWVPGSMRETVTLATGMTPATVVGSALTFLMVGFALFGTALAVMLRVRGSYYSESSPRRERSHSSRS